MSKQPLHLERDTLATFGEQIKQACIEAAVQGLEDAQISGLCGEGALENAIGAIKMMDVTPIIDQHFDQADKTE